MRRIINGLIIPWSRDITNAYSSGRILSGASVICRVYCTACVEMDVGAIDIAV